MNELKKYQTCILIKLSASIAQLDLGRQTFVKVLSKKAKTQS